MNAYDLPTSLTIGGVVHPIRYSWRAIMDILAACADPEITEQDKCECLIKIFYPNYQDIPTDQYECACRAACEFIDCGQKNNGKPKSKMIDWCKDAPIIIPEINKVAGREVRLDPDIHWWTFFGWFMSIGDGLLATVLHIRGKQAKHQKLENWEQDFYKANKNLVDMFVQESEEVHQEKENILKWL